jgi:hypothetical protein
MTRAAAQKKKPVKASARTKKIRPRRKIRAPQQRAKVKIRVGTKTRRKKVPEREKPLTKEEERLLRAIRTRIQRKKKTFTDADLKRFAALTEGKLKIGLDLISEAIKRQTRSRRTARPGGKVTLNQLVMTALSARRPVRKRTAQEKKIVKMASVVKMMERVPTLKKAPDRVKIAAAEMGMMLDRSVERGKNPRLLDDKNWAEKRVV